MLKYKPIYWNITVIFIEGYLKTLFNDSQVKTIKKNAKIEYKNLLSKADNIGSSNPMASNLYMVLTFLSFHTGNKSYISEDILKKMIIYFFERPILKKFLKTQDYNDVKDLNKLKKSIIRSSIWSNNNRDKYPENWEFNFNEGVHSDGFYYFFTKCPIAKFFKDNNLEHLTHYFCEIDYLTLSLRNANLYRNKTLADGDEICDFWIVGNKIKNPK